MALASLRNDIKKLSSPQRAKSSAWFFKTGKGEYGEGDIFIGLTVPESRKLAQKYSHLSFKEIEKLLKSKFHEERLIALLILVHNFENSEAKTKEKIFKFYLKSTQYINNWDLVDLSAHKIVGAYLIISTAWFIKEKQFTDTLKISQTLLKDKHDLIHKAVGWMLREVGKRDQKIEEKFLQKNYLKMPRTMLRYAIERFPEAQRLEYLKGKV